MACYAVGPWYLQLSAIVSRGMVVKEDEPIHFGSLSIERQCIRAQHHDDDVQPTLFIFLLVGAAALIVYSMLAFMPSID